MVLIMLTSTVFPRLSETLHSAGLSRLRRYSAASVRSVMGRGRMYVCMGRMCVCVCVGGGRGLGRVTPQKQAHLIQLPGAVEFVLCSP